MGQSEIIPRELWSEILSRVDDLTLARIVPRVSKLFNSLANDNSDIWRHRCSVKFESESKPESLSWKNYYWTSAVKLFPLFGLFTIGKSTREELCAAPGSVLNTAGRIPYVTHSGTHLRIFGDNHTFSSVNITRMWNIIPAEWEAKGLTWDKSWNDYKSWCKQSFGNYRVVKTPRQKNKDDQVHFVGTLETVVREAPGVLYTIKLKFKHVPGDIDTKSTLDTVFVTSHLDVFQRSSEQELLQRYYAQTCDEGE